MKKEIAEQVKEMVAAGNQPPYLVVFWFGNDGASETYWLIRRDCHEVGFKSEVYVSPSR